MLDAALHLGVVVMFGASFIPTFEIWMALDQQLNGVAFALAIFALAVVVQSLTWMVMARVLQMVALGWKTTSSTHPWNLWVYRVYIISNVFFQSISMLPCLFGTVFYPPIMRFMGSIVKGNSVLYFGADVMDWPYCTFSNHTVIDNARVTGHHMVYWDFVLSPVAVGGVLHEETFASDTDLPRKESGPWRAHVGKCTKAMPIELAQSLFRSSALKR
mmetsp:Transcript_2577/g.6498  ORF Transcript_2577/g.6498 Transcript_2577/m.6498 type:complete len:216 (-) Transcript_2577:2302-2949(-)